MHVGRIDTDGLGMCRPAPADDEPNLRVKAAGLAAMIGVHRAHGAQGAVVSGCINSAAEAALHTELDRPGVAAHVPDTTGWPCAAPDPT